MGPAAGGRYTARMTSERFHAEAYNVGSQSSCPKPSASQSCQEVSAAYTY